MAAVMRSEAVAVSSDMNRLKKKCIAYGQKQADGYSVRVRRGGVHCTVATISILLRKKDQTSHHQTALLAGQSSLLLLVCFILSSIHPSYLILSTGYGRGRQAQTTTRGTVLRTTSRLAAPVSGIRRELIFPPASGDSLCPLERELVPEPLGLDKTYGGYAS